MKVETFLKCYIYCEKTLGNWEEKKDISIFWHSNLRALQQAILEMYREKNEDKKFPEI